MSSNKKVNEKLVLDKSELADLLWFLLELISTAWVVLGYAFK